MKDEQLSSNFWRSEFEASHAATRAGVSNRIPARLMPAAYAIAKQAELIRAFLCVRRGMECAMLISSGYRSKKVNDLVGGSARSSHVRMKALDFTAPRFGSPFDICVVLEPEMDTFGIKQLIHEHTWVHIGFEPVAKRNRVLTVRHVGDETFYEQGILR